MKRFPWKAVAVGGAVVGTAGVIALITRAATGTPPARVALIGDSYAVGLGPELAKLFSVFRYDGRVGISTLGWLSCGTCGKWLIEFQPTIVLVSLGVNDGSTPNLANYQSVVRDIHGIGARVVWIEPPTAVQASADRAIIASLGISTIPAPSLPMANSLHPTTPTGYQMWANEISQWLS